MDSLKLLFWLTLRATALINLF